MQPNNIVLRSFTEIYVVMYMAAVLQLRAFVYRKVWNTSTGTRTLDTAFKRLYVVEVNKSMAIQLCLCRARRHRQTHGQNHRPHSAYFAYRRAEA